MIPVQLTMPNKGKTNARIDNSKKVEDAKKEHHKNLNNNNNSDNDNDNGIEKLKDRVGDKNNHIVRKDYCTKIDKGKVTANKYYAVAMFNTIRHRSKTNCQRKE